MLDIDGLCNIKSQTKGKKVIKNTACVYMKEIITNKKDSYGINP